MYTALTSKEIKVTAHTLPDLITRHCMLCVHINEQLWEMNPISAANEQ